MRNRKVRKLSGFTIVELLIVIVVIGILAGVVIVGYSGVSKRAITASVESDGANAVKVIDMFRLEKDAYPTAINCTATTSDQVCVTPSAGNTYSYTPSSATNPQAYRLYSTNLSTEIASYVSNTVSAPKVESKAVSNLVTGGQLAAGSGHTCAIDSGGKAYCWGQNSYYQLGNGSTSTLSIATAVAVSGGHIFRQISAGYRHNCAVIDNYAAYCWGNNTAGQLGDGTTTKKNVPVSVTGSLYGVQVKSVSAGFDHSCAVTTAGKVYCWGSNAFGQLGNSDAAYLSKTPAPVSLPGNAIAASIVTGQFYTCATDTEGRSYCWGAGESSEPVALDTTNLPATKSIFSINSSARTLHTCAIAEDNRAYCWGGNSYGQLGISESDSVTDPSKVNWSADLADKDVLSISTGLYHTCAIADDSLAYCWGDNSKRQLGVSLGVVATKIPTPTPVDTSGVLGGKKMTGIAAGEYHTCASADDKKVYCWGYNNTKQLGGGSAVLTYSAPVQVVGLTL